MLLFTSLCCNFPFFSRLYEKKRKKMGRAIVVLFTRSLFSSLLFLHSSSSYSTLFWDWGYKFCSGFSTIFIKQVLKKFFNIFCNTFIQSLSINKLVKTWKQKLILFFVFCIFLNPFLYLLSLICTEFLNIVQEIGRDFFCYIFRYNRKWGNRLYTAGCTVYRNSSIVVCYNFHCETILVINQFYIRNW